MKTASGGIGFCGLLTIIFVVAKLTGHFPHSWWWAFSPLWMPVVAMIAVGAVAAVILAIVWHVEHLDDLKRATENARPTDQVFCPRCDARVLREDLRFCTCAVMGCSKCLKLQDGLCPSCYDKREGK